MFMQRYIRHFPAGGEIVISTAVGFCTDDEHDRFLSLCPQIEKYAVDGGTILIKLWLEVGGRLPPRVPITGSSRAN